MSKVTKKLESPLSVEEVVQMVNALQKEGLTIYRISIGVNRSNYADTPSSYHDITFYLESEHTKSDDEGEELLETGTQ